MKTILLISLFAGSQTLACKMTQLGSELRAYDAINAYIGNTVQEQDSMISGIYHIRDGYAYEIVSKGKCQAKVVKVETGADCDHKVVKLDQKINCRLK